MDGRTAAAVLGITQGATRDEIRRAFRARAEMKKDGHFVVPAYIKFIHCQLQLALGGKILDYFAYASHSLVSISLVQIQNGQFYHFHTSWRRGKNIEKDTKALRPGQKPAGLWKLKA